MDRRGERFRRRRSGLATILIRTLSSIPSHWMFRAIFDAGLIWFIGRPDVPASKGVGPGLMLTAVLMHGLWNASGAIASDSVFGWIVPLGIAATLISTFVWIYRNTQPIERKWMRELMAPEVVGGVVTPAELEALAGPRSTYRSYTARTRALHGKEWVSGSSPISRTRSRAPAAPRPSRFKRRALPSRGRAAPRASAERRPFRLVRMERPQAPCARARRSPEASRCHCRAVRRYHRRRYCSDAWPEPPRITWTSSWFPLPLRRRLEAAPLGSASGHVTTVRRSIRSCASTTRS